MRHHDLDAATADLDPPFAVVDMPAYEANALDLVRRAKGKPIRLASKSIRVRQLIERTLTRPGFAGVLAYSLAEANWLVDQGQTDIVVAYPSTDRGAWHALVADDARAGSVTVMVDSVEQLDFVDDILGAGAGHRLIRVALDLDASLRVGRLHLGTRRSPLHTPTEAADAARAIAKRPGFRLVGVMTYEGQVAGVPDTSPAIRMMKRASMRDLATRRRALVEAVRAHAELEFVNGGGTGSLHVTTDDPVVTELAAGSGLFGPSLFDGYAAFTPQPAAILALPVVRRAAPDIVTLFSGGYIASGPAGKARQPVPTYPEGLKLLGAEGAGEVQTPVRGGAARSLRVGDRVWMRHAKAGEMCERFDAVHLIDGDGGRETVPTYRGEGRNFG
ncbi:MAG TPA: amino acid deaminase/aldolase [Nocardioidaceae bacterium]|nr:amino acid deaminase/aldolase [Nocardioidaceae bacterium]